MKFTEDEWREFSKAINFNVHIDSSSFKDWKTAFAYFINVKWIEDMEASQIPSTKEFDKNLFAPIYSPGGSQREEIKAAARKFLLSLQKTNTVLMGPALPSHEGLIFDEGRQRVCVDEVWEDLSDEATKIWKVLWEAKGGWVPGKQAVGECQKAAKIKLLMPDRVKNEIESHSRRGYRLKRFVPA